MIRLSSLHFTRPQRTSFNANLSDLYVLQGYAQKKLFLHSPPPYLLFYFSNWLITYELKTKEINYMHEACLERVWNILSCFNSYLEFSESHNFSDYVLFYTFSNCPASFGFLPNFILDFFLKYEFVWEVILNAARKKECIFIDPNTLKWVQRNKAYDFVLGAKHMSAKQAGLAGWHVWKCLWYV